MLNSFLNYPCPRMERIEKLVNLNLALLEELDSIDFPSLESDTRDYALSQLKKTVGSIVLIIQNDK